jgi:hypothetical protein
MKAIPAPIPRREWKKTGHTLATILLWPYFIMHHANGGFMSFQTFSLDAAAKLRIKTSLLDRFLACMKPASIT